MSSNQTFEVSNLVTKHVTVYADRAEVKRFLKAKLEQGSNEVVIKKLSRSIDPDSIRVDGRGKAIITEVKYQEKHVKKEEEIRSNEKDLNDKLKKLRDERTQIEQQSQRLKKQREIIEGIASQIGSSLTQGGKKSSGGFALITEPNLQNLDKFFSYYAQRASDIDIELTNVQKRLESLAEDINVNEQNLNRLRRNEDNISKEVSIMLDVQERGEIELDLSYLVRDASWTPSYDIRVSTEDKLLKIIYYGLIQQNTSDDWIDAKLSLSTAMPSVGGQVPELNTLRVGFVPQYKIVQPQCKGYSRRSRSIASAGNYLSAKLELLSEAIHEPLPAMENLVTAVNESVISTSFEIVNPTSIPSDNTSHKVTVGIIDLTPAFEYETVPSKSPYAYLKAKIVNSSNYPFLPGPISVFLDNNFVAKSSLKAVSPSEEFDCSLGVDPSVRIEYKAARKFHEESGIISKSSNVTHEQKIEIKNTKAEPIKIFIKEQLPLSSEEKIKVTLIEPNVSNKAEKNVHLNKNTNNVEWEIVIPKNENRLLIFKYTVEHPRGQTIEYKED